MDQAEGPPPSRRQVGPYEVLTLLGRGGMGSVYRARRADLDREVALKVVNPGMLEKRSLRARFQREARALTLISHPNVLRLIDADLSHDPPYLALELLHGSSLEDRVGPGHEPWPRDRVLELGVQVSAGLAALHAEGILHRDLKPGNVFETDDGAFVVMDFGLAGGAPFTRMTQKGDILGTPAYLSPEGWKGAPLTTRSDVYQVGVLLFEAWSGKPPYGADLLEIARNAAQGRLSETGDQADPLREVLQRCLNPDPAGRFEDCAALERALRAAQRGGAPRSRGGSSRSRRGMPRTPRPARRNRGWIAGVLFLTLAVLSAVFPWTSRGPASAVEVSQGPRGPRVTWTTAGRAPSVLEVADAQDATRPAVRIRVQRAARASHQLDLPLVPGRPVRVAALGGDQALGPSAPTVLDADPFWPRDLRREWGPDGRSTLRFRTARAAVARLVRGNDLQVEEASATLEHSLAVPGPRPEAVWDDAALELEAPDGSRRRVPLPGGLEGWVPALRRELRHLRSALAAQLERHVPEASRADEATRKALRTGLEEGGVLAGFQALRGRLQEAFRAEAVPVEAKLRLYEDLEPFDLLDHLFRDQAGTLPVFSVAPLYRGLVDPRYFSPGDPWDQVEHPFGEGTWSWIVNLQRPEGDPPAEAVWRLELGFFDPIRRDTEATYGPFLPRLRTRTAVLVTVPEGARRTHLGVGLPTPPFGGMPLLVEVEGRVRLRLVRGFMMDSRGSIPKDPAASGFSLGEGVLPPGRWRVRLSTRNLPAASGISAWCFPDVRARFEG